VNGPLAGVPGETALPEPPAQLAAITATAPRATNRTAGTTPPCHASCSVRYRTGNYVRCRRPDGTERGSDRFGRSAQCRYGSHSRSV